MKSFFYFIVLQILLVSCSGQDCNKLPAKFSSYNEAIHSVKKSTFKFKDAVNTSKSSWIQSASYFSCNGINGYFIFQAKGKEYIHSEVPYNIWQGFKNSESFGSYYDRNIKHKYILYLKS
jgi:hypothetical protein